MQAIFWRKKSVTSAVEGMVANEGTDGDGIDVRCSCKSVAFVSTIMLCDAFACSHAKNSEDKLKLRSGVRTMPATGHVCPD